MAITAFVPTQGMTLAEHLLADYSKQISAQIFRFEGISRAALLFNVQALGQKVIKMEKL